MYEMCALQFKGVSLIFSRANQRFPRGFCGFTWKRNLFVAIESRAIGGNELRSGSSTSQALKMNYKKGGCHLFSFSPGRRTDVRLSAVVPRAQTLACSCLLTAMPTRNADEDDC